MMDVPAMTSAESEEVITKSRGIKRIEQLNTRARSLLLKSPQQALELATEAQDLAVRLLQVQCKKDDRAIDLADSGDIALCASAYPSYLQPLAESYLMLGRSYTLLSDGDTAYPCLTQALALYSALQHWDGQIKVYYAIARMHLRNGILHLALEACEQGFALRARAGLDVVTLILKTTADVYYSMGQYENSLLHYQQAAALVEKTGDDSMRFGIYEGFGMTYGALGRNPEAIEYLQQALAFTRKKGDARREANALLHLAHVYWGMGEYQQALITNIEALSICDAIGDSLNICYLLGNIANIYMILGNHEMAYEHFTRSLKVAEGIKFLAGQASALGGMAILHAEWKDYQVALEYSYRALAIYEENRDTFNIVGIVCNLGAVYQQIGEREKALTQFQRSLALNKEVDFPEGEITAYYNIGHIYCEEGDYEQAEHFYSMGLAASQAAMSRSKVVRGQYLLGKVYAAQGRTDEARHSLIGVLKDVKELNEKNFELEIHKELAELFEKQGDYERTFHHYREYHKLERELFNEQAHERVKKLQVLHQVEQAEQAQELYRITTEKLQQENEGQKKELASKALYLSQRNELLAKIKKTLRVIAKAAESESATAIRSVVGEIEIALADEQTWGIFEEQFQKIQQPFMQALAEGYPSLSPLEVRVCALIRLNLSSKEVSRILNVAPRSIEMYRYRIRKKFALDPADNLNSFLLRLDQK